MKCRSCKKEILFLLTSTGKYMPCDADAVKPEDEVFDPKRHTSHFATCPAAAKHRKAKDGSKGAT